ncbi:PDC sensor domain-containing protein [Candidatus Parabeggiatoa sp. HSG14]|uniref:PDC sensor domain-containing protein n=1 Tax=Candidatus Parabeggiatoa sp. HSG14 TaxID=3055593 RepID=UPI0025A75F8E|nr:PDC sensor domain-containing protein [Thiotrichales bacterium HSG14]
MWMKQTTKEQREMLKDLFEPSMLNLSKICVLIWSDLENLDKTLNKHFTSIPHCHLVYVVDKSGKQMSSNINVNGIDTTYRDQDLSRRPYSVSLYPKQHLMLSSVYISQTTKGHCISAVQPVIDEQQFLGFLVADFDLRCLPVPIIPSKFTPFRQQHCEISSKPFRRHRVTSLVDKYLNDIQGILSKLINEHGVFHCTLHYASAIAQLWQIDEPYQYRLYDVEQLLDSNMYLIYPRQDYSNNAVISIKDVQQVLECFRSLRLADENIYLCSGSLNIMNGMVGLSFSVDGSEYMSVQDFLIKDLSYWFKRSVNTNQYSHWEKE